MAFMMPVVKNDYDIYRSARSRRSSECSNPCRSRKVSECSKSEGPSLSTSPGSDFLGSPAHRSAPISVSRQHSRSSRNSQSSLLSPCKSNSSSPPKTGSSSSLNKFHMRLVDRLKRSLKCKDGSDEQAERRAVLGYPNRWTVSNIPPITNPKLDRARPQSRSYPRFAYMR